MQEKKYSTKELRALCQEVGAQYNAQTIFGLGNRLVSIYFTKLFLKIDMTPNWITVVSTVIYLVGVGFFATGEMRGAFVGFFLMSLGGILDACDGEVARFRGTKGGYGASYVEPVSHDIMYGFMFLPVAYGAFLQTGNPVALLFGAGASIFKLLYRLGDVRYLYGVVNRQPEEKQRILPKKFKEQSLVKKYLYVVYRHVATSTGVLPPLLVAGIFERLDIYVFSYGTLFFLLWGAQFVKQIRRFRRLTKLPS